MWHCPHCGAPQAETARCWVCRRSSTTCSTCTHFRRALAGDLGYCGLDARRRPLTGLEQRGCWEPNPAAVAEAEQARAVMAVEPHRLRAKPQILRAYRNEASAVRDFVPVESLTRGAAARVQRPDGRAELPTASEPEADRPEVPSAAADVPPPEAEAAPAAAAPTFVFEPDPGWGERTSLFGDPEG